MVTGESRPVRRGVGDSVVVALNAQLLRRLDLRPEASVRAVL
jgi:hypothetical protein